MEKSSVVCVTGGASFLGSFLVKELLQKGYTVHATLRNLDTRLKLFQADVYNAVEFTPAIEGCEVVIHMATPLQHNLESSQYKNTSEAALAAVRSIRASCIQSETVKRFIYTSSVVAASPLKDDGSGYKDTMDETCWTPLCVTVPYANDSLMEYTHSKTLAEKEVLSYQGQNMEVITLACGLVGGDTLLCSMPESMAVMVSQTKNDPMKYSVLRFLEELLAKVPILHIEDVTAAHIFCMENSVASGRYLCANGYLKTAEIAEHFQKYYPDIKIAEEFIEDSERATSWGSRKLEDLGFRYRHDFKMTLNDSVQSAKRMGFLV